MAKRLDLKDVNIFYGKFHAVSDVTLSVPPRNVTAFIGPSGCGKSTVLRSLNRMHEVTPPEPASKVRCCSTVRTSTTRRLIRSVCARPSAWCSSARTRSLPCRFATMSWPAEAAGSSGQEVPRRDRRAVVARCEPVERGQGPPRQAWWRSVGWSATASVHRPGDRGLPRTCCSWTSRARRSTRSPPSPSRT